MSKIMLNADEKLVSEITELLKKGEGYCPCSVTKSGDTKCMCKEFREQEDGPCHCGLFIKIKED